MFWDGLKNLDAYSKTAIGALIIAALGTIGSALVSYVRSNFEARRQLQNNISTSRVTIYAQLHRIIQLSRGQIKYLGDRTKPPYVWITVFNLNLPSAQNIDRIKLLTPIEVYEITSFFYSYQEQLGYIMGNARPSNASGIPGVDPVFMPTGIGIESLTLGYDTSDEMRRKWLIDALQVIADRARRARDAVGEQMLATSIAPTLRRKVTDRIRNDRAALSG